MQALYGTIAGFDVRIFVIPALLAHHYEYVHGSLNTAQPGTETPVSRGK